MPVAASAIAPTRPPGRAVQPTADGDQPDRQHRAGTDADLGAQNAGLRGQHQQQHDTDERDRDAGDGEDLADPALDAWAAGAAAARGGATGGGGGGGQYGRGGG